MVVVVVIVAAAAAAVVVVVVVVVVAAAIVVVLVVLLLVVVVVVVVVYPLVPLGTYGIREASLSDPVAYQPLTFTVCLATFFCFQNSPFPGLLQSSSPFGSLWIPIGCFIFQWIHPAASRLWLIHCHFLTLICNIIGVSPAVSLSKVLLIILGHLMPIMVRKHQITNVRNLIVIWIVTFHDSHS